jgi:hypothetical protein
MAVSSYRKSFAFANTSNTGGKLLVLQAQDSHRTNLRAVQAQVDNGLPKGFGKTAGTGSGARPAAHQAGRGRDRRSAAVVMPDARLHDAPSTAERRGGNKSRGQRSRRRRPASAAAVLSHPVAAARGGLANDTRQSAQGSAAARHSGAATSARRSMTAEGAAIYGEFVELLSCFDKVSALRCRLPAVRGHALGRVSRSDPRVRSDCDARRA